MEIALLDLAKATAGELAGDPKKLVRGAAGLADAAEDDVSFLGNPKYRAQVASTKAGAVFLPRSAKGTDLGAARNRIYVDDPQWAFAQTLSLIEADLKKAVPIIIDPKAEVHYEAKLGDNVAVGAFTVVGRRAIVGRETRIGPLCFIGFNVRIGKGCLIYPHVTIRENCVIGDHVVIHSGAVIGADGFGFSTDPKTGEHRKIPQIGNVVVDDHVEIGSNVSIDRGTVGSTRIGAGTKIDNLVQIAHNVVIGRNCLIVSQVGISGSTKIGDQVILAGQAGLVGHIAIGDGAIVTAQSGVMSDLGPKAVVFGSPARPHREAMKLQALYGRLPELYQKLKDLAARVDPDAGARTARRDDAKHAA